MDGRFRFRGINNGKWYYGGYFKHLPYTPQPIRDGEISEKEYKHLIIQEGFSDWGLPRQMTCIEVEPETIGQCTGLKDKNGKLIYEGDILKISYGKYGEDKQCVYWDNSNARFALRDNELAANAFCESYTKEYEIIGNVYKNKDLLKDF